ncbi:hypothetical protein APHAL10511_000829 [Amanita phalloides]|nr:hypothetical protein APHAL10511_000829 [Amanita phalloides]
MSSIVLNNPGNIPSISIPQCQRLLPPAKSLIDTVDEMERRHLIQERQTQGLPIDHASINTLIDKLDKACRKRAEALHAYMLQTKSQPPKPQQPPSQPITQNAILSGYSTALSVAAELNQTTEFNMSAVANINANGPLAHQSEEVGDGSTSASSENASIAAHMPGVMETDSLAVDLGQVVESRATTNLMVIPQHMNGDNGLQNVPPTARNLRHVTEPDAGRICWFYLRCILMRVAKTPYVSCGNECTAMNYQSHFRFLCDQLAMAPVGGPFRLSLAHSLLGHDIHANINQVLDVAPTFRRRMEIQFRSSTAAPHSHGIPFLNVLYSSRTLQNAHQVPIEFTGDYFILTIPTYNEIFTYKVRTKCRRGHLTYFTLACALVHKYHELASAGKWILICDADRKLYPITSLLQGRLVSLCSENGLVWWPRFAVARAEPFTGIPILPLSQT